MGFRKIFQTWWPLAASWLLMGTELPAVSAVIARLVYEDLAKKLTVWEGDVEGWAVYSVGGGSSELTTEEDARAVAVVKLAQDVLSQTVQGW